MPAETHQRRGSVDACEVLTLLSSLLGNADADATASITLLELGVDEATTGDLWDTVCEEFAERSVGPELEPETFDLCMTLEATASLMATLLGCGTDGT